MTYTFARVSAAVSMKLEDYYPQTKRWWVKLREKTGRLSDQAMTRIDAYRMIRRRARAAGIETPIGCHTFRATGITDYLKNDGRLEIAQRMAGHSNAKTTGLYDRRGDEISLDEVEKIRI